MLTHLGLDYINLIRQKELDLDAALSHAAQQGYGNNQVLLRQHRRGGLAIGYRNDPPLNPQLPYIHGAGGLLSNPGQNPAIFSGVVQAVPGMATFLPILPDVVFSDDYGGNDQLFITAVTGVTAGDDSWTNQPDAVCADAPIAGVMKMCTLTAPYGRFSKATREIDRKRIGRLTNRGEATDYALQNAPMADDPFTPSLVPRGTGDWLNRELQVRFFEAAMGFQRMIIPLAYSGNPSNNKAGGGSRQFSGFDLLYNTGKVDGFTSVPCPGMDSLVVSMGSVNVNEADANGLFFYDHLEGVMRYLRSLARKTGLDPVEWVISMREDLFYTLTDLLPVQQYIKLISTVNTINNGDYGGQLNLAGADVQALRYEMRNNYRLPIDGLPVQVIVDDGIAETAGSPASEYVSDVYIHAVSVLGGVPTLYWQFFNFANGQGEEFDSLVGNDKSFTTDGGRFYWSSNFKNGCLQMQWTTEPRLVQHVPFLCARLDNVAYKPTIHTRSPFPADGNFYNGGRTNGSMGRFYPDWSPSTGVNLPVIK
jgi:hypothetical protein